MIVRIIGRFFLFIIRIRFPRGKSIADIIRNRYGEDNVKKIRRFEKWHFKWRKFYLDLMFLLDSQVYSHYQIRFLEEEDLYLAEEDLYLGK